MDKKYLRICPFCTGMAELKSKKDRVGYAEYMTYVDSMFVECTGCGARSVDIIKTPLCDTTDYRVEDFRENPTLRARVEDEYLIYCKRLEQDAVNSWNKRP